MPKHKFPFGNKFGGRTPGAKNKPVVAPWLDGDQRLAPAQRFRVLIARMATDLGGVENLSQGELQLIRRAAMISVQCEQMEQKAIAGVPFDATVFGHLTGHLTRALRTLGLKRLPREDTPSLRDYLDAARQPDGAFTVEEGETTGNA